MAKTIEEMVLQCRETGTIAVGKAQINGSEEKKVLVLLPIVKGSADGQRTEERVISLALDDHDSVILAEKLLLAANTQECCWTEEQ